MSYTNNVYGIQKTEEQQVRSKGDIAAGAGMGAATGAQVGATFGPIGAGVGALAGAGVGLMAGVAGRKEERRQNAQDKAFNEFVGSLEGRGLRSQQVVAQQAEHGMQSGRYMMAEIEGDGSRYQDGIGEIHVDKNFNIKSLANGAPTHDDGGMKVIMEEGDAVFPTQTSKKKYQQILTDIRRYKTYGDERAKKRLEKERDKLPSDEDYGYVAQQGLQTYQDGVKNAGTYDDAYQAALDSLPVVMTDREERAKYMVEQFGWDSKTKTRPQKEVSPTTSTQSKYQDVVKKYGFDPNKIQNIASTNPNQDELRRELKKEGYDYDKYAEFLDEFIGEGENITGRHVGSAKTIGPMTTEANSRLGQILANEERELAAAQVAPPEPEFDQYVPTEEDDIPSDEFGGFMNSGKDPSELFIRSGNVAEDIPFEEMSPGLQQAARVADGNLNINMGGSDVVEDPSSGKEQTDGGSNFWERGSNPLKYASALTNMAMGLQPAERVTRRQVNADFYDYEDFSATARQENIENRNFMARALGNRVDRSGSLGTMAQVQDRYLDRSEQINENEARRRYAVDQQNTALSNQVQQINTQLAREDDDKDAANRAARQKFQSTAAAEIAELAQYDEQRRYMMSKDRKAEARDQRIIDEGLIGTRDYVYTDEGTTYRGNSYKKGVKSKELKPGSYRMLPDGTIIVD